MRIAVSGTHAAGKSTLVQALSEVLPGYTIVEEAYYALLEGGHAFAAEPGVEDFEVQLERSITSLVEQAAERVLFDRCPADYLAYLSALTHADPDALARWVTPAREALQRLDLVVFVPVERPDRIQVPASEGRRLRTQVDAALREMLVDDAWGFGVPVLEVRGTPQQRVHAVLRRLASLR